MFFGTKRQPPKAYERWSVAEGRAVARYAVHRGILRMAMHIRSTIVVRVNVYPLYRWMCTPMEKPRHATREAGLLLTSIRPATPGYFTVKPTALILDATFSEVLPGRGPS